VRANGLAVLAAAFLAFMAAPAAAQTPLEDFEALCVNTAAEPAAVAAVATGRGWVSVEGPDGFDFQYVMSAPDQRAMLFWGEAMMTIGGQAVARRTCSLGTPDASEAALARAASAWLNGAKPRVNRFGDPEWGFALNRSHTEIPDPASYTEEQLLFMLRQLPIALLAINESRQRGEQEGEPLTMLALSVFALQ
jgi:hypothetical protein